MVKKEGKGVGGRHALGGAWWRREHINDVGYVQKIRYYDQKTNSIINAIVLCV